MPSSKETFKDRLSRYRQIKIKVIGRKSGQTISIPVWFVFESDTLYLLPVRGSRVCTSITWAKKVKTVSELRTALTTNEQCG